MNKDRLINLILTVIVIACFAGAGYSGWLFYQETRTTTEATEDTNELRAAAVQLVSDTAAPESTMTVTAAPPVGETSPTALPSSGDQEENHTNPLEAESTEQVLETATPTPTEALEADPEDDDAQMLVILHNMDFGFDVIATPPPQYSGSAEPSVAPDATAAPQATEQQTEPPKADQTPGVSEAPESTPEPTAEPTLAPPTATPYTPRVGTTVEGTLRLTVDFGMLTNINEDIRAWIYQDGTDLNYPIVQAKDNEHYLTHLFSGNGNKTGTIFMDYGNSPYFSDMITFVYGHNRKDNSMFATIPEYMSQAYYNAHPTIDLVTPYENYLLEIFGLIRINTDQDTEYWHVKFIPNKEEFNSYVSRLQAESYIKTNVEPKWGDQLIALATCTNDVHEDRYILYARMRPVVYANDTDSVSVIKNQFDSAETYSRMVEVPGKGSMQYYAQNDPVWANLVYEAKGESTRRKFGGSGGAPTCMATVLGNLIPDDIYWFLSYYSGLDNGLTFCQDSVNQYYCTHTHAQYRMEKPEEYRRYLPLAIASFCTGNNMYKEVFRWQTGTGTGFFARVCQIYGMTLNTSSDPEVILPILRNGGMGIVNAGVDNPFTGSGHYMTVVYADSNYLYIMDPYIRDSYAETDKSHLITVLEPGLLRVSISNWSRLRLGKFYLFQKLD